MKVVLQNLTKAFPSRNKKSKDDVIAVNNFTFEIPDGKLIGLLGPSGCGKSTTLNLICGLQKPTSGRIFFGEEDVQRMMQYDAVLEIAKNRSQGIVDEVICLYYEKETRRLKNDPAENIIYGWRETPTEAPIFKEDLPEDLPDFDNVWYNK